MVNYYTIRGGSCKNEHAAITLRSSDIICYVGRDKHENEYLIQYGWPGDIWFHVEGLSSAHVYFRVNITTNNTNNHNHTTESGGSGNAGDEEDHESGTQLLQRILMINGNTTTTKSGSKSNTTNTNVLIPIDNLPEESIEDMCQIVKHNSIKGSKLASCKIIYTPHSNLKKTFEMEAGAVTNHDNTLQRSRRCDKNRLRIKELEKTKRVRNNVQYYNEMKHNEQVMIAIRKELKQRGHLHNNNHNKSVDIYDPMLQDMKQQKSKATQQGDTFSGLDSGLANLESLGLVQIAPSDDTNTNTNTNSATTHTSNSNNNITNTNTNGNTTTGDTHLPIWEQEANARLDHHRNERTRFLLARGYTLPEIQQSMETSLGDKEEYSITLSKLWHGVYTSATGDGFLNKNTSTPTHVTTEQIYESRYEEREVLEAIYGEDEQVQFGWKNDDDDNDNSDDDGSSTSIDDDVDVDPTQPFPFDSIYPITNGSYEPPKRYQCPPPLVMEVYVDHNVSDYPYRNQSPVIAITGGGIPTKLLRTITNRIYKTIQARSNECAPDEPCEPYLYDMIQLISEYATEAVHDETKDIATAQTMAKARAKEEAAQRARDEGYDPDVVLGSKSSMKFRSEADRRAYAQSIIGRIPR